MRKNWLIVLLILFVSVHVNGQVSALDQPESIKFSDVSVDSAIRALEIQIGLNFTFRSEFLFDKKRMDAQFQNVPLCIILDSLFSNPKLNYQIIESQLVVYEQKSIHQGEEKEGDSIISNVFSLGGVIKDSGTMEKLPFAAISLQNTVIGTISNNDGLFSLQLSKNSLDKDTLLISYLGYKTIRIPLKNVKEFNVYLLETNSISLHEIVVRGMQPERLIRLAISYKSRNYPDRTFLQRAFYRESIQRDKKYMLYSEGILDVIKRPYRPSLFNEQVKLEKQRSFKSIDSGDTIQFKLSGGIQTSLDLDVVKNGFPFIEEESMPLYNYQMQDMVLNDERLNYKIEFSPKDKDNPMAYEGCIYLDVESLAFVKIEFRYTKKSLERMRNAFVIRRSPKLKIIPIQTSYAVSYKRYEGLYYISHIQGSLTLKVKRKRKLMSSKYRASFEMVATELDRERPKRFSSNQTIRASSIFSDLSANYDLSFWGNENFLLPEEDLMKAFKRLSISQD